MKCLKILALLPLLAMLQSCFSPDITVVSHAAIDTTGEQVKVVFLAGPDSHGPGEHEHKAGSQLLAQALRERAPAIETVNVYGGWPEDEAVFDGAAAIVMYCDGGRSHLVNDHLQSFGQLLDKGVGVVALHYCVEVPKGSESAAAMLDAVGGYFETNWSVNPHWAASFTSLPEHPITTGVKPFRMQDEWYFNMRFKDETVTPILSAVAPLDTMKRSNGAHSGNDVVRQLVAEGKPQVVAWAYTRGDGGRGFGYTGGHFHHNWQDDDARNLVLNAIEWVSQ